jgi:dTDP-4-amino-4,6-dideoxygalactose transaminase
MRHVPYHRSIISDPEIEEVVDTLKSGWLTTGPKTKRFEERFSALKSGKPAVGLSSCTAGLFLSVASLGLEEGDEVITTPMTFVATANVILQNRGKVVFADIERGSMNISAAEIERKITKRTKAIIPVHVGGNPCEMDKIMDLANAHGLEVIEDCAHAIEGEFQGKPLGTFGYSGSFSFYPTKNITTGEGGMAICRDEDLARKIRLMATHGVSKGTWQRMELEHDPLYDVVLPGYKFNMTDIQAALGLPQLDRLETMYARRKSIRSTYDEAFGKQAGFEVIGLNPRGKSAMHLYLMLLHPEVLDVDRATFIREARSLGVELSVNYTPIHLFSYYRSQYCTVPGAFPEAEHCGANVISLPFYPALDDEDIAHVVSVLCGLADKYRR